MAASCEKILHHSVLDFEKKQANVTLTPKYIAVEHINHKQSDSGSSDVKQTTTYCQVISLDEVLAVHPHAPTTTKDKFRIQGGGAVYQAIELQPSPLSFDLYVLKRGSSHRLRHKVLTFTCKNHSTCAVWMDKIKDVLHAQGSSRPKHLLVFVNPFGGKKRAPKVFEKVRPFFDLAGITLDVIETQRQYHARDILQEYDLSTVDGVVCVGGDGTFSEVLNGMLDRVNADEGIEQSFRHQPARPHLRIGVIPAGSTDAVVFTTTGNNDPVTSAFLIIIGASVGVDVTALYKQQEFVKYSITMTSYGYYGDLLADSERFRWMGPKRYNWSGFKKIVLNRAYEGEVSFLPADASNGHPRDGNMCFTGCVVCQRAGKEAEMAHKSLTKSASAPTFDLGSGEFSDGLWSNMDGWRQVTGKFVAINSVTMSCRCELSPEGMSPYTHLGDGCMDLILVSQCDRIDYIKHLSRIPRQNADQFDFSFVQVHRVKEFQFRPLQPAEEEVGAGEEAGPPAQGASSSTLSRTSNSSQKSLKRSTSKNSVWNCDGEVVTHPNLHVQVHCQLVQLFARGVENQGRQEEETCPISCNPCSRC